MCRFVFFIVLTAQSLFSFHLARADEAEKRSIRARDSLSALWSFYKFTFIKDCRVVSLDEGSVTTSEGQGYALLRAVWEGDSKTFRCIWEWTKHNLQVRGDALFSWKWKGRVLDINSATDADTDIALALILASRRFDDFSFLQEAQKIVNDIWERETIAAGQLRYITGGNWAPAEAKPTIHVAYLAPYAYEIFAAIDRTHPWKLAVEGAYHILEWIYFERKLPLPPTLVYADGTSGALLLETNGAKPVFSVDDFPIFWRVALDREWFGRRSWELRQKMIAFFAEEWKHQGRFYDRYDMTGRAQIKIEGLPLYATVHSLALSEAPELAEALAESHLNRLWDKATQGRSTPYYLHNWLWFDRALALDVTQHFDEMLSFLRVFHFETFWRQFKALPFAAMILLFFLTGRVPVARYGFMALALYFCLYYLVWRITSTLNFLETAGPLISISLWAAEVYCFSTVALLVLQVGFKPITDPTPESTPGRALNPKLEPKLEPKLAPTFAPTVDIFIPIYSEPLAILEATLAAAMAIDYPNKRVYVCDDSHLEAVRRLTERLGGNYIRGPKRHAKAGNMNNALQKTSGELVVIFDTDHIPVRSFLNETVPLFSDPKLGFVQTPHHFYNEDIFQRAFLVNDAVPNEQDMFNHAIQKGRDRWGGTFFVGSGAVFRRTAIAQTGGFKTMSITEDIHTSQHLHALGWTSRFVDKDLAAGLTAENLASYVVQRRRWMLGCLQVFFKDNPLFHRGLKLRQRLGYFSSLYYFFFPLARVIFWLTPLYYLLFHWHPLFAEVSEMAAHLLPFLVAMPLLTSVLIPDWPRAVWGTLYEMAVAFPLARSVFDLFLPKNLGFKVTPKGLVSGKRSFDLETSKLTVAAAAITLFAIIKGLGEYHYFQIEKDAYFFNLIWAGINLLTLAASVLVAWERPQRRVQERLRRRLEFEFRGGGESGDASRADVTFKGYSKDISLSGLATETTSLPGLARDLVGEITFADCPEVRFPARVVYTERKRRAWAAKDQVGLRRCRGSQVGAFGTSADRLDYLSTSAGPRVLYRTAWAFVDLPESTRHRLLLHLFADPQAWSSAHEKRARGNLSMVFHFCKGLFNAFR
ncbi:MAG: glycosyl transferase family 2 [Bdellovibrio sp.]|nr:MAG: glycosyl transferase family 2 [Bdellovibrio sp.]